MGSRKRGDRGQTIVEFVLMLPFILLLIMALAEFGGVGYTWVTVNNATSEAARHAAVTMDDPVGCDEGQIQWRAVEMSRGLIDCTDVQVGYYNEQGGEYVRGSGVVVRVNFEYTALTPLPGLVELVSGGTIPSSWTLSSCSDARLESKPDNNGLSNGARCSE